jgi:hypothetical protein
LLAKSYDEAAAGQFFRRAPAALDSSGSDPLKNKSIVNFLNKSGV